MSYVRMRFVFIMDGKKKRSMWQPIKAWKQSWGWIVVKVAEKRSRNVGRGSSKKPLFFSISHIDASAHKLQHVCVDVLHVHTHTHTYTHLLWAFKFIPKMLREMGEGVRMCGDIWGGGTFFNEVRRLKLQYPTMLKSHCFIPTGSVSLAKSIKCNDYWINWSTAAIIFIID